MNIVWCMIVRNVLAEEDIGVFMKIEKHYGEGIMTERFTVKEWDIWDYADSILVIFQDGEFISNKDVVDLLNSLSKENEQLKHRLSKFQSKYDKSKTDEIEILVETENTVLLDKEEFQQYVRRHNELKRHNKRRKQKKKKYRNELKKRLKEISGLKEFIAEDLSSEDKILKGFIEEYL